MVAPQAIGHSLQDTSTASFHDAVEHVADCRENLEAVYVKRRDDLLRFLQYYGVNDADAEEITQDVFVKATDPGRPAPSNLFAWLLTCAKHLAIKRHHRSERERTLSDLQWRRWESKSGAACPSIQTKLEQRQQMELLRRAIRALDPMEARCIILRSQGFTFKEIGERLNVPLRRASYLTTMALEKIVHAVGE